MQSVFEALGGMEGVRRLAGSWHDRVMADPIVSHAFSHGFHPDHVERLAAYWAEALGGPALYSTSKGNEFNVVRMHSCSGERDEMNQLAIACFALALADIGIPASSTLHQVLNNYFTWATTVTMNRHSEAAAKLPSNLPIPKWSWNGLQIEEPSN